VLARRGLGEPVFLTPRLHFEKRDQRAYLLLHGRQPDQPVELGLQFGECPLRLRARHPELIREVVANRLAHAFAERAQRVSGVVERVAAHAGTLPRPNPSGPNGPLRRQPLMSVCVCPYTDH
jgi:hypothetical protein